METRRERKAKGRPSRNPMGLQSPSQHIFGYVIGGGRRSVGVGVGVGELVTCVVCFGGIEFVSLRHVLSRLYPHARMIVDLEWEMPIGDVPGHPHPSLTYSLYIYLSH